MDVTCMHMQINIKNKLIASYNEPKTIIQNYTLKPVLVIQHTRPQACTCTSTCNSTYTSASTRAWAHTHTCIYL